MLKKIQFIFIVCVLFIGILPSFGLDAKAAEQVTTDGFSYEFTADGEAVIITGYDDSISLTPIIPNEIEEKQVVEIGEKAFSSKKITKITIPNSVTSIGTYAFFEATGLTSVTLPNSLETIGVYAFSGVTGLTSVTLPNSLETIEYSAFQGATALTHIEIPNNVKVIDKYAFRGATSLRSIKFHTPATRLVEDVFYDVPKGLKVIGFKDSMLEKYVKGGNDSSRGKYIFEGSEYEITAKDFDYEFMEDRKGVMITGYNDASLNPKIPSEIDGEPVIEIGELAFNNSEITGIVIPNSVTIIGISAFYSAREIKSITLPNSLKSIEDYAFEEATGLTSIEIPKSVTNIGEYAFSGATSLKNVKFNAPSTRVEDDIFYGIPDGLKVVGFKDSSLAKYINESNEDSVGKFIFEGKEYKLTTKDFSYEFTAEGQGVIITGYNDSILSKPTIPSEFEEKPVVEIGKSAFYDSEITGITIPNSVKHIGESAFEDTRSLTTVEIPNGVETIGKYAFEDTRSLTSITIPNSVKHIGEAAFEDARILESIEIPNSVETVGDYAFEDMEALKTIKFYNPLTTLGEDVFYDVPEGLKVIGFKGSKLEAYIKAGNDASPNRFIFEELNKVTFSSNGGTKVASAYTNEKRLIAQPKAPTKTNYRFEGWYADKDFKTKWDFKKVVEKDLTLYAKWSINKQVTFNSDGGTKIASVYAGYKKPITQPKAPTKANHRFEGWYADKDYKTKWDFKTVIEKDLTLYAKWTFLAPAIELKNSTNISDKTVQVTGTTSPNSTVRIVQGSKEIGKGKSDAKGNFTIKISKVKAKSTVEIQVTNAYGNKKTFKKTVADKTAPKVTLASISDKQDTITGKTEAKAKVKIYVNNKHVKTVTANSKGNYSYKVGKKKAGTVIKVIAMDQAGNATTKTVKVLDKTAPAKPSVKSVKASSTTVVGKAEAKSTVYVYRGKTYLGKATTSSKGNYTVKIKKQKKGTTLLVKARDKAKNTSKNTSIKVK